MKKSIVLIALFSTIRICIAQNSTDFEGIIQYKIEYFDNNGNIITDDNLKYLGDSSIAIIKKGNYKQIYPSSSINSIIYHYKTGNYYTIINNYDTIFVTNYTSPSDSIINYSKKDTSLTVLGLLCKCYEVTTTKSKYIFYYSEFLFKDSKYFIKHKTIGYDHFAEDTNSIYLKLIIVNDNMTMEFTAYKITKTKIKNRLFKIPDSPLKHI